MLRWSRVLAIFAASVAVAGGVITAELSQGVRLGSAQIPLKITGNVTYDANAPIKGSCLTVSNPGSSQLFFTNTETDADGHYELSVPDAGNYQLFVEGRGCGDPYLFSYIPQQKTVSIAQPAGTDWTLR